MIAPPTLRVRAPAGGSGARAGAAWRAGGWACRDVPAAATPAGQISQARSSVVVGFFGLGVGRTTSGDDTIVHDGRPSRAHSSLVPLDRPAAPAA